MKRRNLIKGAAAAAVCPFACSKPDTGAQEEELKSQHDGAEAPETGHDPDIYVEYGEVGTGKTTRLVEAAMNWSCRTGGVAVIFSSEHCPHDTLDIMHRLMGENQQERNELWQNRKGGSIATFTGYDAQALKDEYAEYWASESARERGLGDRPVRFFFDSWDRFTVPPEFYPDGYYAASLARPIASAAKLPFMSPTLETPRRRPFAVLAEQLQQEAEAVHVYWRPEATIQRVTVDLKL